MRLPTCLMAPREGTFPMPQPSILAPSLSEFTQRVLMAVLIGAMA